MPQTSGCQNVEYVRQQVHDDEADGRAQDDALNDRIITVEDGIDHELTEARNGEDLFGQTAPARSSPKSRVERDDGDQRIA